MRSRSVKFLAVAALVALPSVVQAQLSCPVVGAGSCSVNATANLTIPSLATITIPSNSIALSSAGITDFTAQQYAPGAFGNVTVVANTSTSVTIGVGAATNWTTAGTGVRPVNTLEYSTDAGATFVAVAASAPLQSGAATAGRSTALQFRAVIPAGATDPANVPGSYSLQVNFTLTAP